MKHVVVLALVLIVGCGNGGTSGGSSGGAAAIKTHEQGADEAVKAFKEYGDVLGGVTDKASAESAKPRVEALAKRFEAIAAGVEKLGLPREGQTTAGKMAAALEVLSPKTTEYVMRVIENPEIAQVLGSAFEAAQAQIIKLRGMLGG
jgi:hypothetical protein